MQNYKKNAMFRFCCYYKTYNKHNWTVIKNRHFSHVVDAKCCCSFQSVWTPLIDSSAYLQAEFNHVLKQKREIKNCSVHQVELMLVSSDVHSLALKHDDPMFSSLLIDLTNHKAVVVVNSQHSHLFTTRMSIIHFTLLFSTCINLYC